MADELIRRSRISWLCSCGSESAVSSESAKPSTTRRPSTRRAAEAGAELRKKAGFDGDWLSAGDLRRRTAIAGRGAFAPGGTRSSIRIARARRAARGSRVWCARVRAIASRRISCQRHGVRVTTERGAIDARRVIVATGYATPDFKPLAGRFRMYRTYVLATEPIDARGRAEIGLSNVWRGTLSGRTITPAGRQIIVC